MYKGGGSVLVGTRFQGMSLATPDLLLSLPLALYSALPVPSGEGETEHAMYPPRKQVEASCARRRCTVKNGPENLLIRSPTGEFSTTRGSHLSLLAIARLVTDYVSEGKMLFMRRLGSFIAEAGLQDCPKPLIVGMVVSTKSSEGPTVQQLCFARLSCGKCQSRSSINSSHNAPPQYVFKPGIVKACTSAPTTRSLAVAVITRRCSLALKVGLRHKAALTAKLRCRKSMRTNVKGGRCNCNSNGTFVICSLRGGPSASKVFRQPNLPWYSVAFLTQ